MSIRSGSLILILGLLAVLFVVAPAPALSGASWKGVLTDGTGTRVEEAVVRLHSASGRDYEATIAKGRFSFAEVVAGTYTVSVTTAGKTWKAATALATKGRSLTGRYASGLGPEL